jgi:hypothetical protein
MTTINIAHKIKVTIIILFSLAFLYQLLYRHNWNAASIATNYRWDVNPLLWPPDG